MSVETAGIVATGARVLRAATATTADLEVSAMVKAAEVAASAPRATLGAKRAAQAVNAQRWG